ncbi:MAG TPA: helicase C-terminal domain-containing protein, partial [Thermoanaerobaculia bacterium]|nr:helicase C-terminal domain-containing protein [Thermoanaerobaculia bacterium]
LLSDRIGLSSARTASEALDALGEVRALVADVAEASGLAGPEGADLAAPPLDRLDEIRLSLESLLVRHLADMRDGGDRVPDDPVLELYFRFARFHDVCRLALPDEGPDPAFDVLASRSRNGLRLSILCKDPSKLIGRTLNAAATVVAMSATLSPHEFYRDLLGLDPERTAILRLPSPFPRENREVLVVPSVDTSYSSRAASVPRIATLVADVARACPGNVLALFPSYRFLDDVLSRLPPLPGRRVMRPSDRSTELERTNVLESLKDGGSPIVLFAVSGGAFAEGVDYPGEMLQGVVVVSPALPQVRFEQERMRLYYDERFEKGFEYAYVIPGMTRVVQSAGRLIRSETDTGVVVLACRRFLKNPYRRHLPADWYLDNPEELSCVDVGARVAAFFERNRVKEETKDETKVETKEAAGG